MLFILQNELYAYYFYWDVAVSGYTSGGSTTNVEPQTAEVYTDEITLEVGKTYSLSYSVSPANASIKEKAWMSYEEDVEIVDDQSNITALSPGKARIYIWIYGQNNIVADACVVNVIPATRIFNEENEDVPEFVTNCNIIVNRSLTADKWGTICLPFAMNEEQAKAAFGDDVEIADFTGYDTEKDVNGNVVGLIINFSDVTAMEVNHPYIIKVHNDVSQFTVEGVDVTPVETPSVIYDNGLSGGEQEIYGSFIGTYAAETTIPRNALFISDNQFWYSNGSKKMKAFRAYFKLQDVLSDIESESRLAQIKMSFSLEETGVKDITRSTPDSNVLYDLQGRRVQNPMKGLYICNGKIVKK